MNTIFIEDEDCKEISFLLLDDLPFFEEDDFTCLDEELFELFFDELEPSKESPDSSESDFA